MFFAWLLQGFFAGWTAEPQPGEKGTNHTNQSEKQSAKGLCSLWLTASALLNPTKPRWLQIQFANKNGYPCWSEFPLPQRCVLAAVKDFLLPTWVGNRQILALSSSTSRSGISASCGVLLAVPFYRYLTSSGIKKWQGSTFLYSKFVCFF